MRQLCSHRRGFLHGCGQGCRCPGGKPNKGVNQLGGLLKVRRRLPTFIAVPTTAGTGSETTIAALITDQETHHKYAIMDLMLIPRYAVLDAELTVGLPPHITAATGMDALTHAVEAYLCWTYQSEGDHPLCAAGGGGSPDDLCQSGEGLSPMASDVTGPDESAPWPHSRPASPLPGRVWAMSTPSPTPWAACTTPPHGLANAVILPIVLEDYVGVLIGVRPKLWPAWQSWPASASPGNSPRKRPRPLLQSHTGQMNRRMGIPEPALTASRRRASPQGLVAWAGAEANPRLSGTCELCSPERYPGRDSRRYSEPRTIRGRAGQGMAYSHCARPCAGCTACARLCPVYRHQRGSGASGMTDQPPPLRDLRGVRPGLSAARGGSETETGAPCCPRVPRRAVAPAPSSIRGRAAPARCVSACAARRALAISRLPKSREVLASAWAEPGRKAHGEVRGLRPVPAGVPHWGPSPWRTPRKRGRAES